MKILKIIIDILLLLITILLQSNNITGRLIHEILGIVIIFLLITHIIINWKWIKSITKNLKKVNIKTKFMYIISILTFIIYFSSIILGILISERIFKFKTMNNSNLVISHMILGTLSIIIMFVHILINLDSILIKIIKNKYIKMIVKWLYIIITIIYSIYLVYNLTHSFEWQMKLNSKSMFGFNQTNNSSEVIVLFDQNNNTIIDNNYIEEGNYSNNNDYIEAGKITQKGFIINNV